MENINGHELKLQPNLKHYRCEATGCGLIVRNARDAALVQPCKFFALAEIHFRTDDGGYCLPSELYYAELVEKKTEAECWGFYCEECLAAFGKKTGRRTTLLQTAWDWMREQQQKSLEELKKVTGYR